MASAHRAVWFGCWLLALTAAALPASAQDVVFVAGSTVPRVQLTGEHFQIQVDGTYFSAPTRSATLSRFGVLGTDLGHSIVVRDRILFFFGDTVGAYRNGDRYYSSRGIPAGTGDSIGYMPNVDFTQCQYINDVATQLAQGVRAPAVDAAACPSLSFFLNPVRGADEHVFKPFVISGLATDESQGTFRVPTSAFTYNDRVYVFASTKLQDATPVGAFWLQSVLAKSEQSPTLWSDTNPPRFTRLYTVSSHAAVADPANPPPVEGGTGKFIASPAVVMDAATIADLGLARFLPRDLQNVDVGFFFGRSWNRAKSDMYLAAVAMRDIDAGTARWFYYAGNGTWSSAEQQSVGLLQVDDVDHHGVTWNPALRRFVLMRGTLGRIVAQFAPAPWGPWSAPVTIFSVAEVWGQRLMHRPGADQIVQSLVPIYNRDGTRMELPDAERGVPYGPALLETYTPNPDGSVTVYYMLSTWNPYQVFLMSSTFRLVGPRQ